MTELSLMEPELLRRAERARGPAPIKRIRWQLSAEHGITVYRLDAVFHVDLMAKRWQRRLG